MSKISFSFPRLQKLFLIAITSAICIFGIWPAQVQAATYTQTFSCSFALARTRWDNICALPQFDNSLGNLLQVDFTLSTTIQTDARFENLDATPRYLNADLGSDIEITTPTNGALISFIPTVNVQQDLASFDGVTIDDVDYAGPSGVTFPRFTDTSSTASTLLPANPNFNLFRTSVAGGVINLPILADSYLNFNGGLAANFATDVNTFAGAQLSVTYFYQAINLAIDKTHSGRFNVGSTNSYTIVVSNPDTDPTPLPITVTDTLPTGLLFVSDNSSVWDCNSSGQIITCVSNTVIPPSGSSSFELNVFVSENALTQVTNQVSVTTTVPDVNLANNTATDPTDINLRPIGQDITYTFPDVCEVNMIRQVPPSQIVGTDPDGDVILLYVIDNLGDPSIGRFYLGYPGNGGVPLAIGQTLTPEDLDNIFYQANTCSDQPMILSFSLIDSGGLGSVRNGNTAILFTRPLPIPQNTNTNNNLATGEFLNDNQQRNRATLGLARTGGY